MEKQTPQSRPTIHQATYRLVRQLVQQLEPITRPGPEAADGPNELDPMELMIELLRQVVTGVAEIRSRMEAVEALLDPALRAALKAAVRD